MWQAGKILKLGVRNSKDNNIFKFWSVIKGIAKFLN